MKKLLTIVCLFSYINFSSSCYQAKSQSNVTSENDYSIITDTNAYNLQKSVKSYLKKGWKPCGGLVINDKRFYQAVYK